MLYGVVFLICGLYATTLALTEQGWYLVLLWPGFCFIGIGLAYLCFGPKTLGKRADGQFPIWSLLCFLPYLGLTRLVWYGYHSINREPIAHEVAPGLWLGRRPHGGELPPAVDLLVDLCAEFTEAPANVRLGTYVSLPTLDATAPAEIPFREIVARIADWPGVVYVHCAMGHGRSATVAAAVLITRGLADSPQQAEKMLQQIRPGVSLKPPQRKLLEAFARA